MKNIRTTWTWATIPALLLVFLLGPPAFAEQFSWKFASYVPSSNKSLGAGQKWWAEEIEKRSKGQIKVQIFWNRQLCGPQEMMQAVKSGLADVVGAAPIYTPGETPMWTLAYLPFLSPPRVDQTLKVYNRMAKESKPLQQELEKFNCVFGGSHDSSSNNLMGKKPVRAIADFKGMRVRCMPDLGKIFREFGAVIVSVPVTETYTALDTGMIDVVVFATEGFRTWKIDEISQYMTIDMDMGALPCFFYINKNSWNRLPDSLKKVVQSVIADQPAFIHTLVEQLKKEAFAVIQKKGIEVIHFPVKDRETLMSKSTTVWDEWAKRSKAYDNAKNALNDYIKIRNEIAPK